MDPAVTPLSDHHYRLALCVHHAPPLANPGSATAEVTAAEHLYYTVLWSISILYNIDIDRPQNAEDSKKNRMLQDATDTGELL